MSSTQEFSPFFHGPQLGGSEFTIGSFSRPIIMWALCRQGLPLVWSLMIHSTCYNDRHVTCVSVLSKCCLMMKKTKFSVRSLWVQSIFHRRRCCHGDTRLNRTKGVQNCMQLDVFAVEKPLGWGRRRDLPRTGQKFWTKLELAPRPGLLSPQLGFFVVRYVLVSFRK